MLKYPFSIFGDSNEMVIFCIVFEFERIQQTYTLLSGVFKRHAILFFFCRAMVRNRTFSKQFLSNMKVFYDII